MGTVEAMSYRLSRLMSTATAGYGAFALVSPDHLGDALEVDQQDRSGMDLLAQTYGVRDLAISSLGVFGRSPQDREGRHAAADRDGPRRRRAAVDQDRLRPRCARRCWPSTLGWAGLNTLALLVDSRRNA